MTKTAPRRFEMSGIFKRGMWRLEMYEWDGSELTSNDIYSIIRTLSLTHEWLMIDEVNANRSPPNGTATSGDTTP